jgi:hypothetical protein
MSIKPIAQISWAVIAHTSRWTTQCQVFAPKRGLTKSFASSMRIARGNQTLAAFAVCFLVVLFSR